MYIGKDFAQHNFGEVFTSGLSVERGNLLDHFAILEFVINEIISHQFLEFESEKSDMMRDLVSAINLNRRIKFLNEWKITDKELCREIQSSIDVRNGLAHKFSISEINYKDKKLMSETDDSNFDIFKNDFTNVWKKLMLIYEKEQEKILTKLKGEMEFDAGKSI